MNGLIYADYFLKPEEAIQRRYEALRAVFVEEEPMHEVAQRFGVGYGTIRNWASEFRRTQDVGQVPLFSVQPPAEERA
jgi:transposase